MEKKIIDLFSNIQRNCFFEVSSELEAPILDGFFKKNEFWVFSIWSFKIFGEVLGFLLMNDSLMQSCKAAKFKRDATVLYCKKIFLPAYPVRLQENPKQKEKVTSVQLLYWE